MAEKSAIPLTAISETGGSHQRYPKAPKYGTFLIILGVVVTITAIAVFILRMLTVGRTGLLGETVFAFGLVSGSFLIAAVRTKLSAPAKSRKLFILAAVALSLLLVFGVWDALTTFMDAGSGDHESHLAQFGGPHLSVVHIIVGSLNILVALAVIVMVTLIVINLRARDWDHMTVGKSALFF